VQKDFCNNICQKRTLRSRSQQIAYTEWHADKVQLIALDHIRLDDAWTEREDVRIARLDRHVQPVMIGRPEGFDAQKVFKRWRRSLAGRCILPEWIVDPENSSFDP
jgi:hypothetical protein